MALGDEVWWRAWQCLGERMILEDFSNLNNFLLIPRHTECYYNSWKNVSYHLTLSSSAWQLWNKLKFLINQASYGSASLVFAQQRRKLLRGQQSPDKNKGRQNLRLKHSLGVLQVGNKISLLNIGCYFQWNLETDPPISSFSMSLLLLKLHCCWFALEPPFPSVKPRYQSWTLAFVAENCKQIQMVLGLDWLSQGKIWNFIYPGRTRDQSGKRRCPEY